MSFHYQFSKNKGILVGSPRVNDNAMVLERRHLHSPSQMSFKAIHVLIYLKNLITWFDFGPSHINAGDTKLAFSACTASELQQQQNLNWGTEILAYYKLVTANMQAHNYYSKNGINGILQLNQKKGSNHSIIILTLSILLIGLTID